MTTIVGSQGDDTITGIRGDNIIRGAGGDDLIIGGKGNDVLRGGQGDDVLTGADCLDVLKGGKGEDTLTGGKHDDTLIGGRDSDLFILSNDAGTDVVVDFRRDAASGEMDMIQLMTGGAAVSVTIADYAGGQRDGAALDTRLEWTAADGRAVVVWVLDAQLALGDFVIA